VLRELFKKGRADLNYAAKKEIVIQEAGSRKQEAEKLSDRINRIET
jgi:hypothetical protein